MAAPNSRFTTDIDLAYEIDNLRITINNAQHRLAFLRSQHLISLVAAQFEVSVRDISGPSRKSAVCRARHAYCFLRRRENAKLIVIAEEICRGHDIVMRSIRVAKKLLIIDPQFLHNYNQIKSDYEA